VKVRMRERQKGAREVFTVSAEARGRGQAGPAIENNATFQAAEGAKEGSEARGSMRAPRKRTRPRPSSKRVEGTAYGRGSAQHM